MTREEMIQFLFQNPYVCVTHFLFDYSEYIYATRNGNVYDENGYLFEDWTSIGLGAHNGIRERIGDMWDDGWRVVGNLKEVTDGKIKQISYGCLPLFQRVRKF